MFRFFYALRQTLREYANERRRHDEQSVKQLSEHKIHGRHGFVKPTRLRVAQRVRLNPLVNRHISVSKRQ